MSALMYLYQFCDSFSFLVLAALGLAIIYGMMGIINLAHGEFIMMGAYISTLLAANGVPLIIAIIAGSVGTGVFGIIIDRLIICRLYNRPLDSVVATWGISLMMCQGCQLIFGASLDGTSTPLGSVSVGSDTFSVYRIVLTIIAILLIIGVYCIFMFTKFGLKARATMQKPSIARSLGVNSDKMYAMTFMIGSALAGLTGALYAPTMSVTPTFGTQFMMQSFVTVIVGGANPLVGTVLSGGLLGIVNSLTSVVIGSFYGRIAILLVAIIFIRVCPKGFSGMVSYIKNKRTKKNTEAR